MDCRWQIYWSMLWELVVPYSKDLLQTKTFSEFFVPFLKSSSNLKHFRGKQDHIGNVFPKLETLKDVVRALSKKRRFRTSFESQHVKGYQTLLKSVWERVYHIFSSLWGGITWKIYPLLIFEILSIFVNTLTANDKYPVRDSENLLFPIQTQLS